MNDRHATMRYTLGIDHERLTYRYGGRNFRLTDVKGKVDRTIRRDWLMYQTLSANMIELALMALAAGSRIPLPGAKPEQGDLEAHKPIAAVGALLQIEEQRPPPEDPVSKYWPQLKTMRVAVRRQGRAEPRITINILADFPMNPAFQTGRQTGSVATGPQLIHDEKLEAALKLSVRDAEASPKSVSANKEVGLVLDLLGRYTEARKYFDQAIKVARSPVDKAQTRRALAISFGFERDCRGAVKADRSAYDYYLESHDFYNAGEVADEVGRLCLDAGDLDTAYDWYGKGHEAGLEEPNISPEHQDLWDFRWAHARARIAARRGKLEEARKFVSIARRILDKGTNPTQQVYFPYLAGYVAFYTGDYKAALTDLQDATPGDPFIECLIAQSYEKLGDHDAASEYYGRVANMNTHSVPAAFARPFARSKLK